MSTCGLGEMETSYDFTTIQDNIIDPRKRILFSKIFNSLLKIEKELHGVSRTQITHTSRELKKIEKGLLSTPEEEAQAAAIIAHWSRVHNGHWENNFIFLREGLACEHARISELNDSELEEILLGEYISLEERLTQLNDEYLAVQALKK